MTSSPTARVLSVNLAVVRPNPYKDDRTTGIDKRPTDDSVHVRAPGTKQDGLGSGLVGDSISDRRAHGGDDQAVYAYAREDLDHWAALLGREVAGGLFGENLTTLGLDVNGAQVGERWKVGADLVLQVTDPRIPCSTFRGIIGEQGWLTTFTAAAIPGAYLRVVTPGDVRAPAEARRHGGECLPRHHARARAAPRHPRGRRRPPCGDARHGGGRPYLLPLVTLDA